MTIPRDISTETDEIKITLNAHLSRVAESVDGALAASFLDGGQVELEMPEREKLKEESAYLSSVVGLGAVIHLAGRNELNLNV